MQVAPDKFRRNFFWVQGPSLEKTLTPEAWRHYDLSRPRHMTTQPTYFAIPPQTGMASEYSIFWVETDRQVQACRGRRYRCRTCCCCELIVIRMPSSAKQTCHSDSLPRCFLLLNAWCPLNGSWHGGPAPHRPWAMSPDQARIKHHTHFIHHTHLSSSVNVSRFWCWG